MFNRILVLCTGNICRSPMAEALLARNYPDRQVESAGIGALTGRPAEADAIELMAERGIDISGHRARQVDENMMTASELVLVMEAYQAQWLHDHFPFARGRIHGLGRWREMEIDDPYQQGRAAFEHSLQQIDDCLADWQSRL